MNDILSNIGLFSMVIATLLLGKWLGARTYYASFEERSEDQNIHPKIREEIERSSKRSKAWPLH